MRRHHLIPTWPVAASGGGGSAPVAPTISLSTTTSSTQVVTISGGSGATSWTAYYKLTSGGGYTSAGAVSVGAGSFTFTGLSASTSYDYKITATNAFGSSDSNVVTQTTSSASVPAAPTQVVAYQSGYPATAYVTFAMPSNGGAAIDQFQALCSSGETSTVSAITIPISGGTAMSCRCDFNGLSNASKTFTVRAHNANGWGSYSSASNAVTPPAYTNTFQSNDAVFIGWGGSVIGNSTLWNNTYLNGGVVRDVAPGTATVPGTYVPSATAPAYPTGYGLTNQLLREVTPAGTGGFAPLLNIFLENTTTNYASNGAFNLNDFNYLVYLAYSSTANLPFLTSAEATINFEDVITAVGGGNITFANQNYPVNGFPVGSTGIFDRTNTGVVGYSTNTATTMAVGGGSWAVNDHVLIQIGDRQYGTNYATGGDAEQFITGPNAGVWTSGQWNVFKVPLGATGLNIKSQNYGLFYKIGLGFVNPSQSVVWMSCVGFSK